jgi:hypothetical protein
MTVFRSALNLSSQAKGLKKATFKNEPLLLFKDGVTISVVVGWLLPN